MLLICEMKTKNTKSVYCNSPEKCFLALRISYSHVFVSIFGRLEHGINLYAYFAIGQSDLLNCFGFIDKIRLKTALSSSLISVLTLNG